MPIWMCAAASWRPGTSRSRPRGAPVPTNTASSALVEHALQAVDALAGDEIHAEVEHVAHFLVDHAFRQAEARDLRPHEAARLRFAVEHGDVVAERREVARATVSEAGPPPMQAMRLPFFFSGGSL